MRIAVLADTHNRVPPALLRGISSADEIWHLGDVCTWYVLDWFRDLGKPVRVVRGNCDDVSDWPWVLEFELEGLRFYLTHIPPAPKTAPPDVDLLLHGHTHVPRDETVNGTRFLNPGCISNAHRGAPASFAWLEIENGRVLDWRVKLVEDL
jgi:putative phosphoesterase